MPMTFQVVGNHISWAEQEVQNVAWHATVAGSPNVEEPRKQTSGRKPVGIAVLATSWAILAIETFATVEANVLLVVQRLGLIGPFLPLPEACPIIPDLIHQFQSIA